ncbi:protein mono-ADP-ribosyltransferase PARP14-like [Haliotis rufescens]|uniref:protein mono-ADP-ribosyltransferase PARP14-like n=1 Tax=Haliotis rufescens TaxID=6454 RepID=UPI00201F0278|nr:protein mono-ADP-ribosyltransferase PARP14-like [Haliotis rufescens]
MAESSDDSRTNRRTNTPAPTSPPGGYQQQPMHGSHAQIPPMYAQGIPAPPSQHTGDPQAQSQFYQRYGGYPPTPGSNSRGGNYPQHPSNMPTYQHGHGYFPQQFQYGAQGSFPGRSEAYGQGSPMAQGQHTQTGYYNTPSPQHPHMGSQQGQARGPYAKRSSSGYASDQHGGDSPRRETSDPGGGPREDPGDTKDPPKTVLVEGIHKSMSKETLELYFESKKRSGGGDVEDIELNLAEGTALLTFQDCEAAARVASRETHDHSGHTLKACLYDISRIYTIVVTGFGSSVIEDTLELYFESTKRSGGGEIERMTLKKGIAHITFKEDGVAQRVVARSHSVAGSDVTVMLDKPRQRKTVKPRTIAVTGFSKLDMDTIEMYFESKKKSGGGEIEQREVNKEKGIMYITFKTEKVFERVLKRPSHGIQGGQLKVVKAGEEELGDSTPTQSSDEEDTEPSATVEIRGYCKSSSDDAITLYFENSRKSGGGPVETFTRDDKKGVIVMTFEDHQVAEKVAARQHKLGDRELQVKMSVPAVMYRDKVLLSGVPDGASEDNIRDFLEARTQHTVDKFLYGEEEGDILVFFTEQFKDFTKLSELVMKREFMKASLKIREIPQTTSITIRNIPENTTEDAVSMYFENSKRSGGGEVEEVVLNLSEELAVVRFKKSSDAESVSERPHTLSQTPVEVSLHFECLGEAGGTTEPPCTKIPDPEHLLDVGDYKIKYLVATGTKMDEIKVELSKLHSDVKIDAGKKEITLSPTYTAEETRTISRTWSRDVLKAMEEQLDTLVVEMIDVNNEIWPVVESKVNEFDKGVDAKVFTDESEWRLVAVGAQEQVTDTIRKMNAVIDTAKTENERRKNQVTQRKKVDGPKLRILKAKGFLNRFTQGYVTVSIEIQTGELVFVGPSEEVQNAIMQMYGESNEITQQTITSFSANMTELLKRPTVQEYLHQRLEQQNMAAEGSWEPGREGIIIYYTSNTGLEALEGFLKSSVQEGTVKLDSEQTPLLKSSDFLEEIEKLKRDRHDRLIISPLADRKRISITSVSEDYDDCRSAVTDFLQRNAIYAEKMMYSQPILKFLVMHCRTNLDSVSQDLKQFSVKFVCTKNPFTVTLKSSQKGLSQAKMFVNCITKTISFQKQVLKRPGIYDFLKSGDVIEQVEKNAKCVISRSGDNSDVTTDTRSASADDSVLKYERAFHCAPDTTRKIHVVVGSMVPLVSDVEAVVVVLKNDLSPDSTQAEAVIDKAGASVMAEVGGRSYMEGDVVITSAGGLQCKRLVHAVGPDANSICSIEEIIKVVITAGLEEADKYRLTSVALPAFNTEVIHRSMSFDERIKYIFEGIKDYFNIRSFVTDVYVCLENSKDCQSAWKQSVSTFGEEHVFAKQKEEDQSGMSTPHRHRQRRQGLSASRSSLNLSSVVTAENEETQAAPAAEASVASVPKPRILLVKADMGVEEADVIVSSSNTNLDLDRGMVSKSLVKHAGPAIQAECKEKYPDGIQLGDIAVTKGGDMQCVEQIYHCVLPNWSEDTGKQTLIDTLNALLLKAHNGGWGSVAIPALGTGHLGYARTLVAKVMYETVIQFGKDNTDTPLRDVLFIVYPGDQESCQVFEAENKKYVESIGGKVAGSQNEIDAERELELERYREGLKAGKERRDNPTEAPAPGHKSSGFFGGIRDWLVGKKTDVPPHGERHEPDFSTQTISKPSEVSLWFYTDEPANVSRAVDLIHSELVRKAQSTTIKDDSLKKWNPEQIERVNKLQNQHGVQVNVNKRVGRIVVTGLLNNVSDACNFIHKMIRDVEREIQEKEYAEALEKVVQWYFMDKDEETANEVMTKYDTLMNAMLEKAFKKGETTRLVHDDFVFDFNDWVEYPVDNDDDKVKIIRRDLVEVSSSKVPDTWEQLGEELAVKQVTAGTTEHQGVLKTITDSFAGATLEVIRIDRVQNNFLYQQFQAKKNQLENQSPTVVVERALWHGTKQEYTMNICNYGFNRSYTDKSQSEYGEGVYFTTAAPAAAQDRYAPVDRSGKRYLFQSRVLTGTFTTGQASFRVPPARDPTTSTTLLYDSVVNDLADPKTFVIFSDTQAYPEYLITVKC